MVPSSMPKIQRLPLHVANQIAAGEVVERPASVVKELVENSLDAGARRVTVDVRDGGRTLRITDDGEGMAEEDALLAFERFATSKLRDAEELWQLTTMGFRGEALASIASIAKVECQTRQRGRDRGTLVRIEGGGEPQCKPAGCPEGTVIEVAELFYNTPARLKFLRAPTTEQGHIQDTLTSLALAHPEVDFVLTINGRESLSTVGARTLKEVAIALLGPELAEDLVEVSAASECGRLRGLVSRPDRVRHDRSRQWLFVNGRWVRHALLARAVEDAFAGHIPGDRHPVFVLFLDVEPAFVDINVHPAKREIRLGQTQAIFGLVKEGVIRAFAQSDWIPAPMPAAYDWAPRWQSSPSPERNAAAMAAYQPPVGAVSMPSFFSEPAAAYDAPSGLPRELDGLKVIAQLHRTYILAEHPDGLFLIDQHNSHERWIYEQLTPGAIVSQELLMPLVLTLSPGELAAAEEFAPRLAELGFGFEPFGPDAWVLRSLPALLPLREAEPTVRELLSRAEATGVVTRRPDDDPIRRTLACHSAIKAGETLTMERMAQLIERLKETRHPLTCPHGRPTGIMISLAELNRRCLRS
ncbi:MAG TPA: DNA mismatch repair endonuclease MutL [Oscillatoriaceae cyanobacterium]